MSTAAVRNKVDESPLSAVSRTNILGVGISIINMKNAVDFSDSLIHAGGRNYICITDVHGIVEAQSDAEFKAILNGSALTTPDGIPLVWVGHLQGFDTIQRVYGPDYLLEICRVSVERGYRHFFFGGRPGVAKQLVQSLSHRFPGLQVVGTYTPPFRPLNDPEERELAALMAQTKPDFFWVGIGSPKQERFMAKYCGKLDSRIMVGVGAAFDIHSGNVKEAPKWVRSSGLQWLHRLIQEPRRLSGRYLICIPSFLWMITLQLLRLRRFNLEG